jgi:hypothetical protein
MKLWQPAFFVVPWRFGSKHFLRRVVPLVEMMRVAKKFSDTWIAF